MAYFQLPNYKTVLELFEGIIDLKKIPSNLLQSKVCDIAYDALSLKRFSSIKKGIKIYISPYPFVNRDGKELNPNLFIEEAIQLGANIIIYKSNKTYINNNVLFIPVNCPREILAQISVRIYDLNKYQIPIFAITGTKGKTSTSHILYFLLQSLIGKTGLVGSANYYQGNLIIENLSPKINGTWLTSLESLELSGFVYELMKTNGKTMVVETTSHAFELFRIHSDMNFCGGIVTNIKYDHLNFHKTVENYITAKMKIIQLLTNSKSIFKKTFILNSSDPQSLLLYKKAKKIEQISTISVSLKDLKQYFFTDYKVSYENDTLKINDGINLYKILAPRILTDYNALNYAMAVLMIHKTFHIDIQKIINIIPQFKGVPGRLQVITTKPFTIIIDDAHEDVSLGAILQNVQYKYSKIIIVFSHTGDRDRTKRPKMGKLAAKYASHSIITTDSNHAEDPKQILKDIENGFRKIKTYGYEIIEERRKAIQKGIDLVKEGELLLVLSLGTETMLDRNGVITPWSDFETVKELLAKKINNKK